MSIIHQWAITWGVSPAAVQDLQIRLGLLSMPLNEATPGSGKSEAWTVSTLRLEASEPHKHMRIWRNNVGALKDLSGRVVRYGLANDSGAMNDIIKSADLIGIRRVLITPQHVGCILGQFISRECKSPDWSYTSTEHEIAQSNWMNLVNGYGGDASFATGPGTL